MGLQAIWYSKTLCRNVKANRFKHTMQQRNSYSMQIPANKQSSFAVFSSPCM